ncbi:MAG: hypothetical protein AB2L16_07270 [Anaerolineaceae bacterium]
MNQQNLLSTEKAAIVCRASRCVRSQLSVSLPSAGAYSARFGTPPVSNANSRKLFAPQTLHHSKTEEN